MNRRIRAPRRSWILPGAHFLSYAAWVSLFKLLVLTLITYFLISSGEGAGALPSGNHVRFQEISDAYASSELILIGLSSVVYLALVCWLNPVTATSFSEVVSLRRLESRFAPGLFHGSMVALAIAIGFCLSGFFKYLGVYVQFEESPLWLTSTLLRVLAIAGMVYCEEFLFRYKIMNAVRRETSDLVAVILMALAYCAIKSLQFDLGTMHLITLFLISILLGLRAIASGDFIRGAAFWMGTLIVFHPVLSLPILGNDFQGIFILKYQPAAEVDEPLVRALTGGAGGPLSSIAFQAVLLVEIARSYRRLKRFA